MAAKYAWIFQILIFTHFSINWVPINTYKWYWVYNGPNWENIGPQSHLFKKSPILLWKTGPYISTFASRHGRTKRCTDLKFGIFPFDYKGNIWAKWEENPRGSCGNFSENLVISYGMTLYHTGLNALWVMTYDQSYQTGSDGCRHDIRPPWTRAKVWGQFGPYWIENSSNFVIVHCVISFFSSVTDILNSNMSSQPLCRS